MDKKLHYYELSFYHDEDDELATENRYSYCIKTEIEPVINDNIALSILMEGYRGNDKDELIKNLTCVQEISEDEALSFFDVEGINRRVNSEYGVYYSR